MNLHGAEKDFVILLAFHQAVRVVYFFFIELGRKDKPGGDFYIGFVLSMRFCYCHFGSIFLTIAVDLIILKALRFRPP